MADRKTIGKVENNKENPENFDVFYKENNEIRKNISINEIFQGETPIENIVISDEAFKGTIIDRFVMPEGIKVIPEGCFHDAEIKVELKLPNSLKEINVGAFYKSKIGSLVIPEGVMLIPSICFAEAEIGELKLPKTFNGIGDVAFSESKIGTLEISEGVSEIPRGCFGNVEIKELKLPSSLRIINVDTFGAFVSAKIGTIKMLEGLTEIPENCFSFSEIGKLKFPNTLNTINPYAFRRAKIGTLEIPNSVTAIPEDCFARSNIKKLKLPITLQVIKASAFAGLEIDSPLYIKQIQIIIKKDIFGESTFKAFKGMIFTDNSESKAKFVAAGLDPKKVVNLSSREERFEALKDKTLLEIRIFEKDLNIDLWDKNYMQPIEGNLLISDEKGKKFNLPGLAMSKIFQHLTLGQLNQLKNDFSNNLKKESKVGSQKPEGMGEQSMFNSNINRDPGRSSKNPVQKKPRNS